MSDKETAPVSVWALTGLAHVAALVVLIALQSTVNAALRGALEQALLGWGLDDESALLAAATTGVILLFVEFSLAMWLIYGWLLPRLWAKAGWHCTDDARQWSKEDMIIVMLMIIIVLLITKGV